MPTRSTHYLLFSEAERGEQGHESHGGRRWRFVLEALADGRRTVVEDQEPRSGPNRLELLAVVRGLEALDGPAKVTLVTRSHYVSHGLRRGLSEWRRHDWRWERFGRWVPVRDHDLWRRVDRALHFHHVDCRVWRFPTHEAAPSGPCAEPSESVDCHHPPCGSAETECCSAMLEHPVAELAGTERFDEGPAVMIIPKKQSPTTAPLRGKYDWFVLRGSWLAAVMAYLVHRLFQPKMAGV